MSQKSFYKDLTAFIRIVRFPILLVAILWVVKAIEFVLDRDFIRFGIYPREGDGIIGIVLSPFIHGNVEHLLSNSFPLFLALVFLQIFYVRVAVVTTIFIWFFTGIFVWLFARPAYHIGASGVVYGLLGFLLSSGLFRRDVKSIALSLLVLAIYSEYFLGYEKIEGVSWESHMLGSLVGTIFAFVFRNVKEPEDPYEDCSDYTFTKQKFFAPDTFEKTRYQRWLESQIHDNNESASD